MDKVALWAVIDQARADADDASDAEQVMAHTVKLLACLPPTEIAAASQTVHDLMADSYRVDLWDAAHVIRLGGCSDDGFDFFRGWLIAQGRTVFERAVADPDTLAELPFVRAAAAKGESYIECPLMVYVAWEAYTAATGEELPDDAYTGEYPELDFDWDFEDNAEVRRRLPKLAALYAY